MLYPIGYGRRPRRKRARRKAPKFNSDHIIRSTFFALCKKHDSPTTLALWLLFKHGEHLQLSQWALDPRGYHDQYLTNVGFSHGIEQFRNDYLCSEFLSKYKGLKTGVDTRQVSLKAFETAEAKCRQTNIVFRDTVLRGITPRVHAVFHGAARKIADILGNVKSVSITDCGWGPGSTFSLVGEDSTLVHKLREKRMSVTHGALPLAQTIVGQDTHWLRARDIEADGECTLLPIEFEVVKGNKITTVPKNAKTDRVIAQEPTLNIFIQKGFGKYIRRRLRRFGVDLDDQSLNQRLAARAYWEDLVTVDLKAASDTISKGLIQHLLPLDWVHALDAVRSKCYLHDGSWVPYQKWSSMGNGYTFELESLIFYSLASACHDLVSPSCVPPSVYGDDVIISAAAYPLFREVIEQSGFTVNSEKTHSDSCFRESCGKHYFCGLDVTPVYQKEIPNVLEEVYRLANRLRRLAFSRDTCRDSCSGLRAAWRGILDFVPRKKHVLPLGTSEDSGFVMSYSDYLEYGIKIPNDQGGKVAQWVFVPKKLYVRNDPLYAYWLRFTPPTAFSGAVGVRRSGIYAHRLRRNYQVPIDAPW